MTIELELFMYLPAVGCADSPQSLGVKSSNEMGAVLVLGVAVDAAH